MVIHAHHWGMNNSPVGARSSETYFHPIDIIVTVIIIIILKL
jgi:hypothetical protein